MQDPLVEDDKKQSVAPALARITYALHVDKELVVDEVAAIFALGGRAADGDEESDGAPHSEEKEDNRQPYELLVDFGVSGLQLLLQAAADTVVFCLCVHLL